MRSFKSFNRNLKAISPIFATLILIAIAVIAGVVVYMFTSGTLAGMTSGGTAGQEKIAIQSVVGDDSANTVDVYYQSISGPIPTINGAILKDASGAQLGLLTISSGATPSATGTLTTLALTGAPATMVSGQQYSVTLTTVAGGSFVSPSFVVVP